MYYTKTDDVMGIRSCEYVREDTFIRSMLWIKFWAVQITVLRCQYIRFALN